MKLWPFHRGIVEAIEDPQVERVTLVKPVRVGFSTLLHGVIAYYVVNDPAPILNVLPTDADCRRVLVSEIERIFEASPKLCGKLPAPKLGDRTGKFRSTMLHRLFEGGSLHFVASRAPRNLRGPTARILLCDEVDAMPVTEEGNPLDLAIDRTTSFRNRKIIIGSTPGDEETSLILPLYEQSDQRVFEVACPECGAFTEILWAHIEWPEGEPHKAAFRCPHCESLVDERHRPRMLSGGRWRAQRPEVTRHAGFRLNALVSPLAACAWPALAQDFLAKKDDSERLKTFVNRFLGQCWRDLEGTTDDAELASRAEDFGTENLPAECLAITAGCDVQRDRVEIVLLGHGRDQTFVLGNEVVWGLPDRDQTWAELDGLLKRTFPHPHGGRLRIDAAAIDAGDGETMDKVIAFCQPRYGRRVVAVKGAPGVRPAIVASKTKRGRLFIVGVDGIKARLTNMMSRRGAIRFSSALEARYFEELCSERRIVKYMRGRPIHQWERIPGRAAEGLDATVYGVAAWELCPTDFDRREAGLRMPVTPDKAPPPTVIRSRWMDRGAGL